MLRKNLPHGISIAEILLSFVFIALLVGLVLFQNNPMNNYSGRDGGIYSYIGHLILEGKTPYLDVWEDKPPGIYYLDAFALWLGKGSRWGIWFMEYIFIYSSACTGFIIMRKLWQSIPAIFGTIVWLIGLNGIISGGNFTEEYPLLFGFLSIYLFLLSTQKPEKWVYDFFIGILFGLSFLFRENNVGVQISISIAWLVTLVSKKQYNLFLKKIFLFLGGFFLILSGVSIYFLTKKAFFSMVEAGLMYNLFDTGSHLHILSSFLKGFFYLGTVAWISFEGYLFIGNQIAQEIRIKNINTFNLFIFICWPVEIILSGLTGRAPGHYFISWLPVCALLSGLTVSKLITFILSTKTYKLISKKAYLILAIMIIITSIVYKKNIVEYKNIFNDFIFNRAAGIEKIEPVANYIRDNTSPEDKVLIWGGQTGLNFMGRRDSPTAYTFYPLYINSPITNKLANGFYSDITTFPPELIIDAYMVAPDEVLSINPDTRAMQILNGKGSLNWPPNLPQVLEYINTNYEVLTVVDGYTIYQYKKLDL